MDIFIGIILIIITTFMLIAMISAIKDIPKERQKYQSRIKNQNVLSETALYHMGGHPYLQSNDIILFQIRNNNTIYFHKENSDTGKEISISELTRYEVKTETDIRHDVTLTRLLTLGIFAFGVKKKTKTEEQFLILSYIQNNVVIDCMFKRKYSGTQIGNIISTITKLKIESNRREREECVN
jgi:hypothetical protein